MDLKPIHVPSISFYIPIHLISSWLIFRISIIQASLVHFHIPLSHIIPHPTSHPYQSKHILFHHMHFYPISSIAFIQSSMIVFFTSTLRVHFGSISHPYPIHILPSAPKASPPTRAASALSTPTPWQAQQTLPSPRRNAAVVQVGLGHRMASVMMDYEWSWWVKLLGSLKNAQNDSKWIKWISNEIAWYMISMISHDYITWYQEKEPYKMTSADLCHFDPSACQNKAKRPDVQTSLRPSRHAFPLRPLWCSGTERGGRQRCSNWHGTFAADGSMVIDGEGEDWWRTSDHIRLYYQVIMDFICFWSQSLQGFPVIQVMSHRFELANAWNRGAEDIYETVQRWHSKECLGSNPRYMSPADHGKSFTSDRGPPTLAL